MKDYFIDKVNVIVDGKSQVETIGAMGSYDPNWIKNKAISDQKKIYPLAEVCNFGPV